MNPDVKAEWVAALRSGDYKQGRGRLRNLDDTFCCLGVLCAIAAKRGVIKPPVQKRGKGWLYDDSIGHLGPKVYPWAGLSSDPHVTIDESASLATFNDDGRTFAEIADAIEAQL